MFLIKNLEIFLHFIIIVNNNESNEAIKTNENHFNKENQSNGSSFNATTSTTIANNGQDQSKTVFTTKASSLVNNNRVCYTINFNYCFCQDIFTKKIFILKFTNNRLNPVYTKVSSH
jgi:hypothetical protein